MTEGGTLEGRVEAILFVSGEAVRVDELAKALGVSMLEIESALNTLRDDYDFNQRGFMLRRFGHQVQLATRALYADDVVRMLQPVQKQSSAKPPWKRWRLWPISSRSQKRKSSRFAESSVTIPFSP